MQDMHEKYNSQIARRTERNRETQADEHALTEFKHRQKASYIYV